MATPRHLLLAVALMAATVGCDRSSSGLNKSTPTPLPTPPNTVEAICDSSRPAVDRLERRLGDADDGSLSDHGATVAQITGILTTDAERLRSLSGGRTELEHWFRSIEHAAAAGVTAVRAAAAGHAGEYRSAVDEFQRRWAAARAASMSSGYPSCPY